MFIEKYQQFVRNYEENEKTKQLPKILHPLNLNSEEIYDNGDDENYDDQLIDLNVNSDVEDVDNHTSQDKLHLLINITSIVELFQLFCSTQLKTVFPTLYILLKICIT